MRREDVAPRNPSGLPEIRIDAAHSNQKVLAHPELIRKFAEGEEFRPIHMRVGLTGACNMRCTFCNFHSPREGEFYDLFSFQDKLATEDAVRLFSEFASSGGKAVTLCGSGECTVHPDYVRICRAARADGLRIGLITNGSRLPVPEIRRVVAETHTWVRVGMNAGTPATFAKVTRLREDAFEAILLAVGQLRREAREPDFRVGLNYVITADNWHEIGLAARRARETGAHYLRFEPEFYTASSHESIQPVLGGIADGLLAAAAEATADFEVAVPKLDRGPMDQTDRVEGRFDRCHYSRFVTAVGADGNLYPCPQVHLNSRYRIGNVVQDGYLTVLEAGARAEWERSNPLRTDLCKSCFYRPQNELLELVRHGAQGVEALLAEYQLEVPSTLHREFV